jgi:hypothetical protein
MSSGFLLVCLFIAHVFTVNSVSNDTMELEFYLEMGLFRRDPVKYAQENHWRLSCDVKSPSPLFPMKVMTALEVSSRFQASNVGTVECPTVSHATCPEYCHLFNNSCGASERILWFMNEYMDEGYVVRNTSEILVQGPKRVRKIMELFVESEGHCNHMLDPNINIMGATFKHNNVNIFVANFAYCSKYPVRQFRFRKYD